jgi:hypothetical protein
MIRKHEAMIYLIGFFTLGAIVPGQSVGMDMKEGDDGLATIVEMLDVTARRINALELASRKEHHAYLVEERGRTEPFDEYLEKYADFARFGKPATDAEIAGLGTLSNVAIPPVLLAFYREKGSFSGGTHLDNLRIPGPAELRREQNTRSWPHRSMGLVDVIRYVRDGDRPEFDPRSSGGLTAEELDSLNARFSICAWRLVEEGEGHEFIYFDDSGKFGILYYHQDDDLESRQDDVRRLLDGSPAGKSFADALRDLLGNVEADYFDE